MNKKVQWLIRLRLIRWLPVTVFIGVSAMSLFVWRELNRQEQIQIENLVSAKTSSVKSIFQTKLDSYLLELIRMGKRFEQSKAVDAKLWESAAAMLLQHYDAYRAVAFIDPSFQVRRVAPSGAAKFSRDFEIPGRVEERLLREVSERWRTVTVSRVRDLKQGGKGILSYVPVWQSGELTDVQPDSRTLEGFIVGVLDIEKLFDSLVSEHLTRHHFSAAIFDGDNLVYPHAGAPLARQAGWRQESAIQLYNLSLQMLIWPSERFLNDMRFYLPELVLITGLFLAFLITVVTFLAQTAWLRAKEVGIVNDQLEHEARGRELANRKLEEKTKSLEDANQKLKEMSALKDEFVANVSHELRTPLTTIKEGVGLVLDQAVGPLNDEQKDFLGTVDENINRLTELISNMLDLSKIEARRFILHRKRLDIREVIDTTVKTYKPIAGHRNLNLELESVPEVFADPNRIIQVLGNLFTNAVKFTRDDGAIRFQARRIDGHVAVSVRDNGVGISPEDVPKLFQKFSQVGAGENRPRGTGLGLALCKEIIALHKGTISVESERGKGAAFTFKLPVYETNFCLEEAFEEILGALSQAHASEVGMMVINHESLFARLAGKAPVHRIEHLEQSADFLRRNIHHSDVVLAVEPHWVVILAIADKSGMDAMIRRLKEQLQKWVHESFALEGQEFPFGTAVFPKDAANIRGLFQKAAGSQRS